MRTDIVSIRLASRESLWKGSGILLDRRHVLTAWHVVEEAGDRPIFVGMVPGYGKPVQASIKSRHPRYDAAVLLLDEAEASDVQPSTLLQAWRSLTGLSVEVRAITPTHEALHVATHYEVTSYDSAHGEYELVPQLAQGNSGGVLMHGGAVVALLCRRAKNDPLSRALALHNIETWIGSVLGNARSGGESDKADDPQPLEEELNPRGEPGLSHRLGAIHLHVDGAQAKELIVELAQRHRAEGYTAEVSEVSRSCPGVQRTEESLRGFYALHTPGPAEAETLDFFSTTQLHPGPRLPDAITCGRIADVTNSVLGGLEALAASAHHVVVELERVVGVVDEMGRAEIDPVLSLRQDDGEVAGISNAFLFAPFNSREPRVLQPAARYEFHFSIDIPRTATDHPVELEYLGELGRSAGIKVGGWFMFRDAERWAYRSNSFEPVVSVRLLEQRWQQMAERLKRDANPALQKATVRLLAEEPLAVWKTPLMPDQEDQLTLNGLAKWEYGLAAAKADALWVLLPNFLGDTHIRVTAAMRRNLERDVHYVYYLRSSADARRWLDFRARMARDVPRAIELMTAYIVEFSQPDFWHRNAAFIALWNDRPAQGYGLRINPATNQVIAGFELRNSKIHEIREMLAPAVQSSARRWEFVVPASQPTDVVAVCLHLKRIPTEEEFEYLDLELATHASAYKGEVAFYGKKSITVIFVHSGRLAFGIDLAIAFARSALQGIAELGLPDNPSRVGVAAGSARRVPRAWGLLWTGAALRESRQLLNHAPKRPGVYLSATAAAAYAAHAAPAAGEPDPIVPVPGEDLFELRAT